MDDSLSLEEILTHSKIGKLFLEFAIKSHTVDNLEFWLEAEIYKHLKEEETMQRTARQYVFIYLLLFFVCDLSMPVQCTGAIHNIYHNITLTFHTF